MPEPLLLAVDQGTSSTKCLLVDTRGTVLARAGVPVAVEYPRPGWVEQSAAEILDSVHAAARACLAGVDPARVAGVGLSTQRESVLLWDRASGAPLGPMLSWQDQRAAEVCARLRTNGHAELVRARSGLPLDPMFSAAKASWLLDEFDPGRATTGICLGTVDSWLRFRLTGTHAIEVGNAARTQLLNIATAGWDDDLLALFGIPRPILPEIVPSCGTGERVTIGPVDDVPLAAVLGDSHAALFAHGVSDAVKVTYGTGSSVMRLTDQAHPTGAVCTTIAWGDPSPRLALEGNIRSSGATVSWLGRLTGLSAKEIGELAATSDSGGVHIVPAFGGLGAPWWDDTAVGLIDGLTFATTPAHLARAAVESVAWQVADVVAALPGGRPTAIVADGGASANDTLMQLQADMCGAPVRRATHPELSALGAAELAARTLGLWAAPPGGAIEYDEFTPGGTADAAGWHSAVARSRLNNQ